MNDDNDRGAKPSTILTDGLYQKRAVIKLVRSQCALIMRGGISAKEIKIALAKIPDEAKLVDKEEHCADSDYFGEYIFIFEVETKSDG